MKVTDFIDAKNKIVYDVTGVILVPDDQIIEVPKRDLSMTWDLRCTTRFWMKQWLN